VHTFWRKRGIYQYWEGMEVGMCTKMTRSLWCDGGEVVRRNGNCRSLNQTWCAEDVKDVTTRSWCNTTTRIFSFTLEKKPTPVCGQLNSADFLFDLSPKTDPCETLAHTLTTRFATIWTLITWPPIPPISHFTAPLLQHDLVPTYSRNPR
jgi:hypothetical protein